MISTDNAGRPRTDYGNALIGINPRRWVLEHGIVKKFRGAHAELISGVTLQIANGNRLLIEAAGAGGFTRAHTHAAARSDQGITLEKHPFGHLRPPVTNVIDVARHIDMRRTGFNAGGSRRAHILLGVFESLESRYRFRRFELCSEVFDRPQNRFG